MERKRYLIEIGTGVDMHGGDMTGAALKAVKDAMSHCCMAGGREVRFYDDVEIIPAPGGASEKGLHVAEMGAGDTLVAALAIITVYLKFE